MRKNYSNTFEKLRDFCEKENFKGWDPYDGLNSRIFQKMPFLKNIHFFRLVWIQFFKKSPLNLRNLFLIEKDFNPKGLGLFLSGYCNLYKIEKKQEYLQKINFLANELINLQNQNFSGACWGYNFDWQSRAFFLKKNTPTVVATGFIAYALMNAYDITKNEKYLESALSSCNFIIKDLNRTKKEKGFIFSYSPFDNTRVYNASLIGSRLLARSYFYTKKSELIELSKNSVISCANEQKEDGSWIYGELKVQNWVDSFHTGYNLECINEYQKYSQDFSFEKNLKIGLNYYKKNFFLEDGTPKYFDNKTYPIDIHCPSQMIITFSRLNIFKENKKLIDKVLNWTINNMQDKNGYFYYQLKKGISSKIPYMRWAQAWMFYALSEYLKNDK